jgi:hypothetical protein
MPLLTALRCKLPVVLCLQLRETAAVLSCVAFFTAAVFYCWCHVFEDWASGMAQAACTSCWCLCLLLGDQVGISCWFQLLLVMLASASGKHAMSFLFFCQQPR